ncbi:non-ribosomal peptide synthetase [Streptomyces telluris]|uniref:Non-ribosomal peptide synthetase n=1 Tax=Streptomyces telluris TaxID=2720021 RepID=A0A9X2LF90_9ACTN|nr:non-ribosomal peptide synthetase [Streptomyces telluris]MCQ8769822.1 non-ribosomal peptide synthetase [Streptomyces telluris]NJP77575.1 amino acid adenylation domain-containing protein [Streptomyces telluris]
MSNDDLPAGHVRPPRKEHTLWLLDELVPDSGANNLSLAIRVRGRLDAAATAKAVQLLVERFEVLRTVYHRDETGLIKSVPASLAVGLEEAERHGGAEDELAALTAFVAAPFTTDGSPLVRALLLHGPDADVFCLAVHHAVSDVQSTAILRAEFVSLYEAVAAGEPPVLDEVPAWHGPETSEESRQYWREKMAGFRSSGLELWCEQREQAVTTLRGDEVTHVLSPEAHEVVRRLQRELRAPESVVLLTAYAVLLAAHGAGPDLAIGSPVNTRPREAVNTVGYHSNLVTLRLLLERSASFRDLAALTRRTFMEAMAHMDVPADDVLDMVERDGSGWRNTLFKHVFNYVPFVEDQRTFSVAGTEAELVVVENGFSQFDLEFFVSASRESATVRAVFYTGVLDRADVELMVRRYDALLVAVGAALDAPLASLPVWSPQDHAVIDAANATDREIGLPTVLAGFARRAAAAPTAPAVRDGDSTATYGTLWSAAADTAARLTAAGVRRGDVVALLLPRGAALAASVFGTWLAGAAYMPLDPNHPAERLAYQLEDSGARAVITGAGTEAPAGYATVPAADWENLPEAPVDTAAAEAAGPGDLAYVIYTSGSTGKPKGIPIKHRSLVNHIVDYADRFGVAGSARPTGWLSTYSFDTSSLELMMPLLHGGHTVVLPDAARTDGDLLAAAVTAHDIGFLQATPTTWRLVAREAGEAVAGRTILTGGEPLPAELADTLLAAGAELWNVYGPTESTIWATAGRMSADRTGRVDVGSPVANTRVFIADPHGRPLPVGVRGELCVAGVGVASGYHERPGMTAERFGENAEYGRFHRSGDVASWRPDGRIDLFGRVDRQVKLRGNRIELAEVEAVLLSHPDVEAAAVVVVGDPGADGSLAAFVRVPGRPEAVDELWDHAHRQLPRSVVPHRFVAVDAFPRTGSDKVDYLALAERAAEQHGPAVGGAAAQAAGDDLTATVLGLFTELLQRQDLDAGSHFFANGGHSLMAATLAQRIKDITGVRLALTDVFETPTPAALAERLRRLA